MSLQTSTNTISGSSKLPTNKQTFGGRPGGGGNATEKECHFKHQQIQFLDLQNFQQTNKLSAAGQGVEEMQQRKNVTSNINKYNFWIFKTSNKQTNFRRQARGWRKCNRERMSLQTSTNTISGSSKLPTNKQTFGG